MVSHVASLAKAGNELGAEYLVAITFFALVPLLMLGGLKLHHKRRLKAEKRAAAAAVGEDASAARAGGVAVVQAAAGPAVHEETASLPESRAQPNAARNKMVRPRRSPRHSCTPTFPDDACALACNPGAQSSCDCGHSS